MTRMVTEVGVPVAMSILSQEHERQKRHRSAIITAAIKESGISYSAIAKELGVSRPALSTRIKEGLTENYAREIVKVLRHQAAGLLTFAEKYLNDASAPSAKKKNGTR